MTDKNEKLSRHEVGTPHPASGQTVGRRKRASARVRLTVGKGVIIINDKTLAEFFPHFDLQEAVLSPLKAVKKETRVDVSVKVNGGGPKGQAEAVKLGIARALIKDDEELKKTLKSQGFLTRDARIKERKKPGLKKARRAPQWSKR